MDRAHFLEFSGALLATSHIGSQMPSPSGIAGVLVPATALATEANRIATSVLPIEIYNHSLRTFLFAELIAKALRIDHDLENVFVASILHDTGLSATYMSEKNRFDVDGVNVARNLSRRFGGSERRGEIIWDAIALHDSSLAQWKQPEVELVNDGVNADFGAFLDMLNPEDVSSVLRAAPRTNFVPSFLEAVAVLATKKPFATGNCFVTDVASRKVPGFHLTNFCDAIQEDPFTAFETQ